MTILLSVPRECLRDAGKQPELVEADRGDPASIADQVGIDDAIPIEKHGLV
jgi:hypothetical protein